MSVRAAQVPPRVDLRAARGVRSSRDGILLLVLGAGAWGILALQWTGAFPIHGTRDNLALFFFALFFPAAGVFDLWLVRRSRRELRLSISEKGIATDEHPAVIPWGRIRQVVDDGTSVDVMARGSKDGEHDGLVFFKRPFEPWADAEKALRYYLALHSIENNFR